MNIFKLLAQIPPVHIDVMGILISMVLLLPAASANESIRINATFQLDAVGNARKIQTFTFPTKTYQRIKQETDNPENVMLEFYPPVDWAETDVVSSHFDDAKRQVVVESFQKGYCQTTRSGAWEIRRSKGNHLVEVISSRDDRVVLHGASSSNYGVVSVVVVFEFAEGTQNVTVSNQTDLVIGFERVPTFADTESIREDSKSQWEMGVCKALMSSLAKIYSNEDYQGMWTGRSVFTNTRSTAITNFEVRYKVEGYSSWCPWKRSPVVYPGQSVVTSYYPILDIDQLKTLSGSRTAAVMAEYRFVDADGKQVEETDAKSIDILDRNLALFSTTDDVDVANWYQANHVAPLLISCYCNSEDRVVQQLAGRISGMANGPAASSSDEGAELYLYAIWKFMQDNDVKLQSTSEAKIDGRSARRIKYARDVLTSRSGTKLDLAIFWVTLAKAVGLQAEILIGDGDFVPVIVFPSGARIPIDASKTGEIKLTEAVSAGAEARQKAMSGDHYVVNVNRMESEGARALDLESVSEDYLSKQHYVFQPLPRQNQTPQQNGH